MIADLQREMEQMRTTMRRHGILDDEMLTCDGDYSRPLSERSNTLDNQSTGEIGEVQEDLPLPTVVEHEDEATTLNSTT